MRLRTVLACSMIACAMPALAQELSFEGFSQLRYTYSDKEGDGDFDTRRVRLGWTGKVNDAGTSARLMVDVGKLLSGGEDDSVDLVYAWVAHPITEEWRVQFGYGLLQFGTDVCYSSAARVPFERSRAASAFFPGVFTLGLQLGYQPADSPLRLDLQLTDGMDAWHSPARFDDAETLLARARYLLGEGSEVGVSYVTSDVDLRPAALPAQDGGGESFSPDAWGLYLLWNGEIEGAGDLRLQAECFDGDWYDHKAYRMQDADGWYGLVQLTPAGTDLTPFYRYDEFSYDAVSPAQSGSASSDYSRHTLGVAWEPLESNRFTLQIEDIDDRGVDDSTVGLQWQVSYR